jgi:hypothetical protein
MPLIAACRALGVRPPAFESMAAASYSEHGLLKPLLGAETSDIYADHASAATFLVKCTRLR